MKKRLGVDKAIIARKYSKIWGFPQNMCHRESVGLGCCLFSFEKPQVKLPEKTILWSFSGLLNADLFKTQESHIFQGLKGGGGGGPLPKKANDFKKEIAVVLDKHEPWVCSINGSYSVWKLKRTMAYFLRAGFHLLFFVENCSLAML